MSQDECRIQFRLSGKPIAALPRSRRARQFNWSPHRRGALSRTSLPLAGGRRRGGCIFGGGGEWMSGKGWRSGSFVVTVPGRGYNFVAPVRPEEPSPAPLPPMIALAGAHNLPFAVTRMIGRDEAVTAIISQLSHQRPVTVVGPSGHGWLWPAPIGFWPRVLLLTLLRIWLGR